MNPVFALALLFLAPLASAQTLYVDDDAPGPGTGTVTDPFPGIQEALDDPSCVPGTTVRIRPGEYEPFNVTTSDLTIVAESGPMVTIVNVTDSPGSGVSAVFCEMHGLWFRGAPGAVQACGIFVAIGARAEIYRCVFTDLQTAFINAWDFYAIDSAVVRCDLAYLAAGQDLAGVTNTFFWDTASIAQGSLTGQPSLDNCYFEDPLTFGPNDFHLRRVSPCIDAGLGQPDPDGTPRDIGPFPYDWNHPFGDSYCFNEANSTGMPGRIQLLGTSSLSELAAGGELTVQASRCPADQFGVLVVGEGVGEIPLAAGGTLCVGTPTGRVGPVALNGNGAGSRVWLHPSNLAGLQAGDPRTVQLWHRDSTPGGTGLTHAVRIELLP